MELPAYSLSIGRGSVSVKIIKSFSLFVAFDHKSCFVFFN